MSPFLNGIKIFAISLGVALLGGLVQAIINFHPTDQIGTFLMTTLGSLVIAGLNALIHKLQGTTVAKTTDVVSK